jgi:PAS domain S-box-containing protein
MGDPLRILFVDPHGETDVQDALEAARDIAITRVPTPDEALSKLGSEFDCVLSVSDFPDSDGFEFLRQLRERNSAVPFVFSPRDGGETLASRAFEADVDGYIPADTSDGETVRTYIRSQVETARQRLAQTRAGRPPEESQKLLQAISDTFPDSMYIYSESGVYLDVILGRQRVELNTRKWLLGQRVDDVLSTETAETLRAAIDRALDTGELQVIEYTITEEEATYWFEGALTSIPGGFGGEPAVLCSARDVTKRKQQERELRETTEQLTQRNERLEQFAGVVSHDLRNPLNAAQLQLDLFRQEKADGHIDEMEQSLNRMQTMIEDLLALARAGTTVEDPEDVSLADVATKSWETVQTDDADFEVTVNESTTVWADKDRLRHVFENLFRNAVDHNDPPLTVKVGLVDASNTTTDDSQYSGFFIEDDGDGIPEDEHDDILSHGYTTSDDGTGFGLSIVEDIVKAHDWTIRIAESNEGGARFEITGVEVSDCPTDSWY